MKKIFFIILLIPLILVAQPKQSGVNFNSTYTALNSAGVWTGNGELITSNYSWVIVTVKSDQSSATSGLKVMQSRDGVNWVAYDLFSYTASDTLTNRYFVPIRNNWIKVSYANGTTAQTTFSLTTTYQNNTLPTDASGNLKVNGTVSVTGGATGLLYTRTYAPYWDVPRDSLVNKDTVVYNPTLRALKREVKYYNPSTTTPDTVAIEIWSDVANKWTSQGFALTDQFTLFPESNNLLIIIPQSTAGTYKSWSIEGYYPNKVRMRSLSTRARTTYVGFKDIN